MDTKNKSGYFSVAKPACISWPVYPIKVNTKCFFPPLLSYHDNQAALTSCKVEAEFTNFSMPLIYICKHCENLNMFCWIKPTRLREKYISNSVILLTFSLPSKVV